MFLINAFLYLKVVTAVISLPQTQARSFVNISSVFHPAGQVILSPETILLSFNFNVSLVIEQCHSLLRTSQIMEPKLNHEQRVSWNHNARLQIEQQCQQIESWPRLQHRDRRGIFGTLLLGTVGTIFGWMTTSEIHHLQAQQQDTYKDLHNLQTRLQTLGEQFRTFAYAEEELARAIDTYKETQEFQHLASQFLHVTDSFARGLDQLNHQRITPDLITFHQLLQAWPKLLDIAQQQEHQLPVLHPRQLYQLPAFFSTTTDGISIILLIPLVQQHFQLYRIEHFPWVLTNDDIVQPIIPRFQADFLAYNSKTNDHLLLTAQDLLSAQKIQAVPVLQSNIYFFKSLSQTCEGSLFSNNQRAVKENCDLVTTSLRWKVVQLSPTSFLIFSRLTLHFKLICPNSSTTNSIRGVHRLHIPTECHLTSDFLSIPSRRVSSLDAAEFHLPTDWNYADFWNNHSTDHLINVIHQAGQETTSVLHLLKKDAENSARRRRREQVNRHHLSLTIICSVLAALIFIILIAVLTRYYFIFKTKN